MPPKKVKSLFFFLVRVIISGGILFYLFRKTDLENLKAIFLRINLLYYILAFLCVVIFQSLVALRWKFICGSWNFHKSFIYFLQIYLMGFSLNTVFPGIIAGDTLRGYFLVKEGLEWKKATFSVILDRAYGLLGIMVILSLSLPFCSSFLPPKFRIFLFLMVYTSLFSFFLITLLVKKRENLMFQPLFFPFALKPLFIGLIIQIFFVFQFIALGSSLGLTLEKPLYFVIIPIISFLSALPLSISGLGIREGTLSYFLYLLNYPVEYGLSIGFLSYSLILLSSLPGLIFYLTKKNKYYLSSFETSHAKAIP